MRNDEDKLSISEGDNKIPVQPDMSVVMHTLSGDMILNGKPIDSSSGKEADVPKLLSEPLMTNFEPGDFKEDIEELKAQIYEKDKINQKLQCQIIKLKSRRSSSRSSLTVERQSCTKLRDKLRDIRKDAEQARFTGSGRRSSTKSLRRFSRGSSVSGMGDIDKKSESIPTAVDSKVALDKHYCSDGQLDAITKDDTSMSQPLKFAPLDKEAAERREKLMSEKTDDKKKSYNDWNCSEIMVL